MRASPLLLAITFALAGCSHPGLPTAPDMGPASPEAAGLEVADLFARVNRHRDSLGLAPLAWHPAAAWVAERHSTDMRRRSYFSHITPEGLDLAARLRDAGIAYWAAGENLATGEPDAAAALAGWLASPEHRSTLESPDYTHQGIGVVDGIWTHEFLRPREAGPALVSARGESEAQ